MRMPPNSIARVALNVLRSAFNGGRHAHAAESLATIRISRRSMSPSMEGGMRMPPNRPTPPSGHGGPVASMEGGMRMPPNRDDEVACGTQLEASMEGGMRMPPNPRSVTLGPSRRRRLQWRAACACRRIHGPATRPRIGPAAPSMEGGMRMPPNRRA